MPKGVECAFLSDSPGSPHSRPPRSSKLEQSIEVLRLEKLREEQDAAHARRYIKVKSGDI